MNESATHILMCAPGVDIDATRIGHIIHLVTGSTPEEAAHAANLIIDYLIVTFQHAGSVRLQ